MFDDYVVMYLRPWEGSEGYVTDDSYRVQRISVLELSLGASWMRTVLF